MSRLLRFQLRRIKNFLYSQKCKKFLVFLFFLFVSACFWTLQTLRETLDIDLVCPLQLQQVPQNTVLTLPPPAEITVKLQDKGAILSKYFLQKKDIPLTLDFSKYDKGAITDRVIVPHNDVRQLLQAHLGSNTQVVGISPDTIEYYYNRGLPRRLPVKVQGNVLTTAQTYLMDMQCTPDSVSFYAPRELADTMKCVYTVPINWKNLQETVTRDVELLPIKGVRYDTPSVQVKALVDYYIEKSVSIPVIGLNFPGDKILRTFPAKVKVTFRVGETLANQDWEHAFVLLVTYEELLHNNGPKLHLQLKNIPEDVSHVRIYPQDVDYLIEHNVHDTP